MSTERVRMREMQSLRPKIPKIHDDAHEVT